MFKPNIYYQYKSTYHSNYNYTVVSLRYIKNIRSNSKKESQSF